MPSGEQTVRRLIAWLAEDSARSIVMAHASFNGKPGLFLRLVRSHNGHQPNDVTSIQYGDDMLAMIGMALDEIG